MIDYNILLDIMAVVIVITTSIMLFALAFGLAIALYKDFFK